MKIVKKNLVTLLFALGSVSFGVPVVIQLIKGEPVNATFLVFALVFFALALVFFAIGRKSGNGSGPSIHTGR